MRFGRGQVQMLELDLAVGPGQFESALNSAWLVILIGQHKRFVPAGGQCRDESDRHRLMGRYRNAAAERKDRVEDGSRGSGESRAWVHCDWRFERPSASKELLPARLPLHSAEDFRRRRKDV